MALVILVDDIYQEQAIVDSFSCNTLYHPFQPENRNKPIFVIGQSSQQLYCFQSSAYRMTVNDNTYDGNSGKAVETLLNYAKMTFILVPVAPQQLFTLR